MNRILPTKVRPASGTRFDANERFLGVGTVSTYFDVTDVTIKNWVDAGKLRAARTPGGHRRISVSSVVALLEEQGRAIPQELAQKPSALVVEREELLGKLIRRGIGTRAQVVSVSDQYAAVFAAARAVPAVIILDLDLPQCDTRRLLNAMRSDDAIRDVDVVAVVSPTSAKQAHGLPRDSEGSGMVYLYRKTEKEAIVASVIAILDRGRPRRD